MTEQLLSSDAVDRAVAQIDFKVLSGRKVYVDTNYIQPIKNIGFVNDRYIVSSMRQQMAAAGCLLQDKEEDAEVIVEPRVGALGTDMHEVVYGIPANNLLANVSTLAPAGSPQLPAIPEISVAKKNHHLGAAKLSVFAYERESRQPLWQSGIAQAESRARDTWVMGAGPFQSGSIYDRTQFAGSEIHVPLVYDVPEEEPKVQLTYEHPFVFSPQEMEQAGGEVVQVAANEPPAADPAPDEKNAEVKTANHETPAAADDPAVTEAAPEQKPATADPAKSVVEKKPAPETAAARQADAPADAAVEAASLPADLMQHLEQFSRPMGQPAAPWYNPSPLFSGNN